MGSGEADAPRHLPHGLDAMTKCRMDGCDWRVPLPETFCWQHGGEDGPAIFSDAWGADLYHMPQNPEPVES